MPFFILFLLILFSTPSFSQPMKESPLQVWKVGDRRWMTEEDIQYGKDYEGLISPNISGKFLPKSK
jgi:hypothetical protein